MSASNAFSAVEATQTIDFYDDCNPPVRVYVGGKEIPVINEMVETQARIDGPMDINFSSDIHFPVEWQGQDIVSDISVFQSDSDVWQPIDVQFIDPETVDDDDPEYVTYHRGFPHRYGPGSKDTLERKLRVGDISLLLKGIPFTASYGNDATLGDILEDIVDRFEREQSVFNNISVAQIDHAVNDFLEEDSNYSSIGEAVKDIYSPQRITQRISALGAEFGLTSQVSFQSNEDTLMDAMNYVTKHLDGDLYFAPDGDDYHDIALIYDKNRNKRFSAGGFDSDGPTLIKNNALYEIQPINSLEVQGSPRNRLRDRAVDALTGDFSGDQTYPVATARHKQLYEQANMELKPPIVPSDGRNDKAVEEKAREELIDQLEGGGMGNIHLHLFPYIEPHDVIKAPPACSENIDGDATPLEYSVESVTHKVAYDDDTGSLHKRSILRVNTHVTREDIEITVEERSLEDHE